MSRSYKKISIIKDHNKGSKQLSKQAIRNKVKQKLKSIDENTVLPIEKEVFNSYNVCDYKCFTKDVRYKRK